MLEANEASRLMAFVESVYGSSYPSDVLTCEKTISSLINEGLLYSSIAIDGDNRIVAHIAAILDKKSDITADCVGNMVHPDMRGSDIASRVSFPLIDIYSKKNIAGLHLYAVTMHTISQKKIMAGGGGVTGFLLGDWPSDISVEGFSAKNIGVRMPILMMYYSLADVPPRNIYLPELYAGIAREIYTNIKVQRNIKITRQIHNSLKFSESIVVDKKRQGSTFLRYEVIGDDWKNHYDSFYSKFNRPALYIDIPLHSPISVAVIEELRNVGWYFGGILVERNNTDYLRMQNSGVNLTIENTNLLEAGSRMSAFVLNDRKDVA